MISAYCQTVAISGCDLTLVPAINMAAAALGFMATSARSLCGWAVTILKWLFLAAVAAVLLNQAALHLEADVLTPTGEQLTFTLIL